MACPGCLHKRTCRLMHLKKEIKNVQKVCGIHCLLFTVSVQFHIPVSGIHMQKFSRQGVIGLQQKSAVKQVILND